MLVRLILPVFLIGLAPLPAQEYEYPSNLDVPYVPSPDIVVKAMLKLAAVTKNGTVVDLGCGDGRIVVTAALEFGASGIGYDLNPERIKEANANAAKAGVDKRVHFVEKNLFDADIHEATVVTLYLLPGVNEKLKPRLLAQLKPGTRVVSHSFSMPDWPPKQELRVDGRTVYLWVIPDRQAK